MRRPLIILAAGLLAVGCGKSETERLESENEKLKPNPAKPRTISQKDVIGTYEREEVVERITGNWIKTTRYVLRDNNTVKFSLSSMYNKDQVLADDWKWSIVNNEVHIESSVYRVNPDNSITVIAQIKDGKRNDTPEYKGQTMKKVQ